MTDDDMLRIAIQQLSTDNHRLKRTMLVAAAVLAVVLLPGWFHGQEPDVVPVQQVLRTHRLELTDAAGKVVAVLQSADRRNDDVVVGYNTNGVKQFEAHVKNGNYDGMYTSWNMFGLKTAEGTFIEGRKQGVWRAYSSPANDTEFGKVFPLSLGEYQKGLKVGKWQTWRYATGQRESEGSYDEKGLMTGEWQFWKPDGLKDEARSGKYEAGGKIG